MCRRARIAATTKNLARWTLSIRPFLHFNTAFPDSFRQIVQVISEFHTLPPVFADADKAHTGSHNGVCDGCGGVTIPGVVDAIEDGVLVGTVPCVEIHGCGYRWHNGE